MRVLVTGADGMVGKNLQTLVHLKPDLYSASENDKVEYVFCTRADADLTDFTQTFKLL
jgi:dTDP-4-dehydrorhamnose reductase